MFLFFYSINKTYIFLIFLLHKSERGNSKRKWIPETRKREQLPGGSKKYIFGFLPILVKFPGFFGFLEESILFKI